MISDVASVLMTAFLVGSALVLSVVVALGYGHGGER